MTILGYSPSRFPGAIAAHAPPVSPPLPSPSRRVAAAARAAAGRALLPAVFLFAVLAGCKGGHRSLAELAGSLPLPPGTERVAITIDNGSVRLVPADGPDLRYVGGVRRGAPTEELLAILESVPLSFRGAPDPSRPGTFVLTAPRVPEIEGPAGAPLARDAVFAFELEFAVPRGIAVDLRVAGSGHLVARSLDGELKLDTGRGDLRLEHCTGAADARTGRGTVIVVDHEGDLQVRASVGEMQVFVKKPGARLSLVTNEGNLQCYVPPDAGFVVDARAEIGKIANGFGMPMEKVGEFGAVTRGSRGDERTAIVLRTGKGRLSLSHKDFR